MIRTAGSLTVWPRCYSGDTTVCTRCGSQKPLCLQPFCSLFCTCSLTVGILLCLPPTNPGLMPGLRIRLFQPRTALRIRSRGYRADTQTLPCAQDSEGSVEVGCFRGLCLDTQPIGGILQIQQRSFSLGNLRPLWLSSPYLDLRSTARRARPARQRTPASRLWGANHPGARRGPFGDGLLQGVHQLLVL